MGNRQKKNTQKEEQLNNDIETALKVIQYLEKKYDINKMDDYIAGRLPQK